MIHNNNYLMKRIQVYPLMFMVHIYIFLYKSSLKFDHYYFITDGSQNCVIDQSATENKQTNKQIFLFPIKEPFQAEQLTKNLIQ
jgi:hypothetical protein